MHLKQLNENCFIIVMKDWSGKKIINFTYKDNLFFVPINGEHLRSKTIWFVANFDNVTNS